MPVTAPWYNTTMTTLRAHFDGRVLIPDEPVDLPRDRTLLLEVQEMTSPDNSRLGFDREIGLPVVKVPPHAKTVTSDDVRRADDEY